MENIHCAAVGVLPVAIGAAAASISIPAANDRSSDRAGHNADHHGRLDTASERATAAESHLDSY